MSQKHPESEERHFSIGYRVRKGDRTGTVTHLLNGWYRVNWDKGCEKNKCNRYGSWELQPIIDMSKPKQIDDGGPMFPVPSVGTGDPRDGMTCGHDGASLRDWFAGEALAGMLANPGMNPRDIGNKEISELAMFFADAMIAERNKSNEPTT